MKIKLIIAATLLLSGASVPGQTTTTEWVCYVGGFEPSKSPRGTFVWSKDVDFSFAEFMPSIVEWDSTVDHGSIDWIEVPPDVNHVEQLLLRIHGKDVVMHTYRKEGLEGPPNRLATVLLTYDNRPFCITEPEFFQVFVHVPPKDQPRVVVTESMSGTGASERHIVYTFDATRPSIFRAQPGGTSDVRFRDLQE